METAACGELRDAWRYVIKELIIISDAIRKKMSATARRSDPRGPLKNLVASKSICAVSKLSRLVSVPKVIDKGLLVEIGFETSLMSKSLI